MGYDIRGCNVRVGRDEIDVVAFDPHDGVLVFCEVKARRRHHPDYSPLLACTKRKRAKMFRAARAYVARDGWEGGYRLDWLLVAEGKVTGHIREVSSDGVA